MKRESFYMGTSEHFFSVDESTPVWTTWHGGECPVHPDTKVNYRLRGGGEHTYRAGGLHWRRFGGADDIVEYRVVEPPIQPNNDEVICPACVHQFRAIPVNVQTELSALRAELSEAQREHGETHAYAGKLGVAVGLLTTLHPTMEMDVNDPVGMAQKIAGFVGGTIDGLRDEIERLRSARRAAGEQIENLQHQNADLRTRIETQAGDYSKLHAENERLRKTADHRAESIRTLYNDKIALRARLADAEHDRDRWMADYHSLEDATATAKKPEPLTHKQTNHLLDLMNAWNKAPAGYPARAAWQSLVAYVESLRS